MPEKILMLSDVNSVHTQKLAKGVAAHGFDVGIFSLTKQKQDWFGKKQITVFDEHAFPDEIFSASASHKSAYLKKIRPLKKLVREYQPDIVHAHYATSYGLLGWRSGFHPLIISAWGSDLLDFPKSNSVKRWLIRKILESADQLMVTSVTLEDEVKKICDRAATITPFGVDTTKFHRFDQPRPFAEDALVFGAIKSLETVYALDVLINAFAQLKSRNPQKKVHLLLVGDGTKRASLEALVKRKGLEDSVTFAGRVDHSEIAKYHNMIDVFINVSWYESFGVSVLEAMSCERPVIVTNTGGLAEIVDEGKTGFRVPVDNVEAITAAMEKLFDPKLRETLGKNGRVKVQNEFEWEVTMRVMTYAYEQMLAKKLTP